MKKILLAAAFVSAMTAAAAQAGEIFVGGFAHDVTFVGETIGVGAAGKEDGVDLQLGLRSAPIEALEWIGGPKAYALVSLNSDDTTNFAVVGLAWTIDFGEEDGFYFQPGLGIGYQDGYDELPSYSEPGLSEAEIARRVALRSQRVEFGSNWVFQPELSLGYRFNERLAAELTYTHLSHGQILGKGKNEGLDDAGVRLVYSF